MKVYLNVLFLLLLLFVSSCKKDPVLVDNNNAPQGSYVSTLQIRNYINRMYIDLLGREALDAEMTRDLSYLKENQLSAEAREVLITRLQTDTAYIPGDTSYKHAYFNRLYEVFKQRMIEGVEDDYILEEKGVQAAALSSAEMSGDSLTAGQIRQEIQEMDDVLAVRTDYRTGAIDIETVFYRFLNNFVFDKINMNSFNFVNAGFDNLLFRFPSSQEFTQSYNMVEHNRTGNVLGMSGSNRGDFMFILTHCDEFYEGLVRWQYRLLVSRDPNAVEMSTLTRRLRDSRSLQDLQLQIIKTDEYANFR